MLKKSYFHPLWVVRVIFNLESSTRGLVAKEFYAVSYFFLSMRCSEYKFMIASGISWSLFSSWGIAALSAVVTTEITLVLIFCI